MNNSLTRFVFDHCSLQASPKQIRALNQKPPVIFGGGQLAAGYKVMLTGYAEFIFRKESRGADAISLDKLLNSLRATPRPLDGLALKGSTDTYRLENDYFQVCYRVISGQVQVYNIQPVDRIKKQRDRLEKAALYKIEKTASGFWQTTGRADKVSTAHGAVNGQSSNLAKATWLMGRHLEYEFGASLKEYTLFHNPSAGGLGDTWESVRDKFGFTTDVTKAFAKILSATQAANNRTKWVAHSQGGLIFTEAVRYLLNDGSSLPLNKLRLNGYRHPNKGALLDKQSIAFHSSASNNRRSKALLDRAGIDVISILGHDYDFVTNLIGFNTNEFREFAGSLVYMSHVLSGSVQQSPHTLPQTMSRWRDNMAGGPGRGRSLLQKAFAKTAGAQIKMAENYLL